MKALQRHLTATRRSRSAIEACFAPLISCPVDKNLQHSTAATRLWPLSQPNCPDGIEAWVYEMEPDRAKEQDLKDARQLCL
jgi:hypothetical protein